MKKFKPVGSYIRVLLYYKREEGALKAALVSTYRSYPRDKQYYITEIK